MSVENQHMEFKQEFRIWVTVKKLTNQIALREERMDAGFWEEVYPKMDI
jgi:hypothetical protein